MRLVYAYQEWPYAEVFRISRSASENSPLFVVNLWDGDLCGRGECGILPQYGQTREDVIAAFEAARPLLEARVDRAGIQRAVANSSVRNALDCALWDLECRRSGRSVWELAGVQFRSSIEVDITISVNPLEKMREDAMKAVAQGYRILKLKADASQVIERVSAIARAVPGTSFIVDANEAWTLETLRSLSEPLHRLGVGLIEQPLPHGRDEGLERYDGPVPLCADESCRDVNDLDVLAARYASINIKLDKVGGLTPGLELARAAKARGMGLMIGCSGPTSLGIAPAYVLGTLADHNDLDGPALLQEDRANAMQYREGRLHSFGAALWGGGPPA